MARTLLLLILGSAPLLACLNDGRMGRQEAEFRAAYAGPGGPGPALPSATAPVAILVGGIALIAIGVLCYLRVSARGQGSRAS